MNKPREFEVEIKSQVTGHGDSMNVAYIGIEYMGWSDVNHEKIVGSIPRIVVAKDAYDDIRAKADKLAFVLERYMADDHNYYRAARRVLKEYRGEE